MKLTLTQSKLNGMHSAITYVLNVHVEDDNLLTKLLTELVDKFNERLRERLRKLDKEGKWETSLKMNTIEQRAFYSWFYLRRHFLDSSGRWQYELLIMDDLASEIAQQHA